jgi:nitroreductase
LHPLEVIYNLASIYHSGSERLIRKSIFYVKWADYLEEGTPPFGERPAAYIVLLLNRKIRKKGGQYDLGMAAENIMLTAIEEGVGTCCIGSIDRERLTEILAIPKHCDVELVIALGYPDQISIPEDMTNSVKYWVDENNVVHVPKRKLNDVLHKNFY